MRKLLFLVIPLLLTINTFGGYRIKSVSIDDNLLSNRIKSLEIDSLNSLWIGSDLGLHSYNNDNLITHDLFTGTDIESIHQLSKGHVLVLSNKGLFHYSYINDIYQRIGSNNKKFTSVYRHNKKLYLIDTENKIYCYTDSLIELIDIKDIIPDLPANASLSKLFFTSEKKMIIAIDNYGVLTLDSDNFQVKNSYKTYVWKYKKILEFNNRIYIATYSGLFVFNTNGDLLQVINKRNSKLPANVIMDLCVNKKRNEVWLVLDNFGIYVLNNELKTYNISDLPDYKDFKNKSITSIQIDKFNNIYAGTVFEGVLIAVNSPFREIIPETQNNNFKPLVISVYKDSSNIIWCGTDNVGLFSVDSLGIIKSYFQDRYRVINFIVPYSENELLVAVYNEGIYLFNKNTGTYTPLNEVDKLKRIKMQVDSNMFADKRNNIWIFSDSLYCIEANRKSIKSIKSFSNEKNIVPKQLTQDSLGKLWFVSGNSLLCYDINTDSYIYANQIDTDEILSSSICASKNGEVVVTSNNTIYKIDTNTDDVVKFNFPVHDRSVVSTFYNLENNIYIFMTSKDIVTAQLSDSLSNIAIGNTSCLDSRMYFQNSSMITDNRMYAGYNGGICLFNVNDLFYKKEDNEILILSIKGSNARYNIADTTFVLYNGKEEIAFRRPVSDYTFMFQGSMIANLDQVKYKYILEGVDKDWIVADRNYINYSKLKPGNYVFRIKSIDNRGFQGKETTLEIKIMSPILISTIFIVIYALLAAAVLVFLFLYYRKKLKSEIIVDWNIQGKSKLVFSNDNKNEEVFISEFKSLIERNISNCNLHVDEIAKELHVSRTVLYEKVKKISGHSVKAFINTVRLEKAKIMLENPTNNINDISFQCGFSSASYFSTAFKNAFKISPSKYRSDFIKQM